MSPEERTGSGTGDTTDGRTGTRGGRTRGTTRDEDDTTSGGRDGTVTGGSKDTTGETSAIEGEESGATDNAIGGAS